MKNLLLFPLLITAALANSTTLYSWHEHSRTLSKGFTESGFGGPDSLCYVGKPIGVCKIIQKEQVILDKAYGEGAHGTFYIHSCNVKESLVTVNYTRHNDYDKDVGVNLVAKECVFRMQLF